MSERRSSADTGQSAGQGTPSPPAPRSKSKVQAAPISRVAGDAEDADDPTLLDRRAQALALAAAESHKAEERAAREARRSAPSLDTTQQVKPPLGLETGPSPPAPVADDDEAPTELAVERRISSAIVAAAAASD